MSGRPDHRHSPIGESERGETDGSVEPNHGAGGARGFARDRISATDFNRRSVASHHIRAEPRCGARAPAVEPHARARIRRGLTCTLPRTRHGPARPDHRRSHIGESKYEENDGSVEPNHDVGGAKARATVFRAWYGAQPEDRPRTTSYTSRAAMWRTRPPRSSMARISCVIVFAMTSE